MNSNLLLIRFLSGCGMKLDCRGTFKNMESMEKKLADFIYFNEHVVFTLKLLISWQKAYYYLQKLK